MSTIARDRPRPRPTRGARPITDFLERGGGGIALVVAAGSVAAGLATAMRLILPS